MYKKYEKKVFPTPLESWTKGQIQIIQEPLQELISCLEENIPVELRDICITGLQAIIKDECYDKFQEMLEVHSGEIEGHLKGKNIKKELDFICEKLKILRHVYCHPYPHNRYQNHPDYETYSKENPTAYPPVPNGYVAVEHNTAFLQKTPPIKEQGTHIRILNNGFFFEPKGILSLNNVSDFELGNKLLTATKLKKYIEECVWFHTHAWKETKAEMEDAEVKNAPQVKFSGKLPDPLSQKHYGSFFSTSTSDQQVINFQRHTCEIRTSREGVVYIYTSDETLVLDEHDKPVFRNDRGESVIEYTGLATDGNPSRSWAKASYQANASSQLHYHLDRTEIYYITDGQARVTMNDSVLELSAGDSITIPAGVPHQVYNTSSEDRRLVLIVKCTPAWTIEDSHLVEELSASHEILEKSEKWNKSGNLSVKPTSIPSDLEVVGKGLYLSTSPEKHTPWPSTNKISSSTELSASSLNRAGMFASKDIRETNKVTSASGLSTSKDFASSTQNFNYES